jgi:hypothetical protein
MVIGQSSGGAFGRVGFGDVVAGAAFFRLVYSGVSRHRRSGINVMIFT